jgi:hypothetical protein
MRTRTRLLIGWALLASTQLVWMGCGSSEGDFSTPSGSDGGPDGTTGTGGSATGGRGGTSGSSGTAGSGGSGTAGAGGTTGGNGGAAGSSGTTGSGGAAGRSGASGSGGTSGSAGSSGSAGGGMDAGTNADGRTADAGSGSDVATDRRGDAGCPDVFGTYDISSASGTCGDFNENAPQAIRGTTQVCALHFISVVDGGIGAINGGATLGANGTFSAATLIEGTASRSPCSGTWDSQQEEMTVVCGGAGDSCTVVLQRTGP